MAELDKVSLPEKHYPYSMADMYMGDRFNPFYHNWNLWIVTRVISCRFLPACLLLLDQDKHFAYLQRFKFFLKLFFHDYYCDVDNDDND